jgi:hypothetical protein
MSLISKTINTTLKNNNYNKNVINNNCDIMSMMKNKQNNLNYTMNVNPNPLCMSQYYS